MYYTTNSIYNFNLVNENHIPDQEYNFDYPIKTGEIVTFSLEDHKLFPDIGSGEDFIVSLFMSYNYSPYILGLCEDLGTWEFDKQCDIYVPSGEHITDIELDTYKNYEYNFEMCTEWDFNDDIDLAHDCLFRSLFTGESCEFDLNTSKNYEYIFEICNDYNDIGNLNSDYIEPCFIPFRLNSGYGGEICGGELTFESILVTVPGNPDNNIELNNCDSISNLNILNCQKKLEVSGKNHNFDITLCSGETNPQPIDFTPHNFSFNRPWNYRCEAVTSLGYSGEISSASILTGIKLPLDSNYTGEESHTNYLSLEIKFSNAKMDSGEQLLNFDLDTRPAVNFIFNHFTGEEGFSDLYRTLYLDTDIAYTGEELPDDYLVTTPPIRFEYDFESGDNFIGALAGTVVLIGTMEHGELGLFDLKLDPLIELENPTIESGEQLLSIELIDKPAPSMFPRMYSGENGLSYLNVTYVMYPNVYDGSETYVEALNTDTSISVDAYSSESVVADILTNNADELEPNVYDGSEGLAFINTETRMYPRSEYNGEYQYPLTLTTFVFSGMEGKGKSGEESVVDELFEETEYYLSDENGESADASMSREISLYFQSGYTGERCQTESLNLEYILLPTDENFSGESARIPLFYVTPGPKLELRAYHGEMIDLETNILYYPIFYPEIIISSQNMRDGWGGAGGLNFCEDACCDPYPSYPHIEPLDFDIRPEDREPWGRCGAKEDTQAFFNLTMGVRFSPNITTGESGKMFMLREYLPFGKMDSSCDNYETDPECGEDGFDDENQPCLTICSPLVCEDGEDREGEPCVHDDLYWLYNRNPQKFKTKKSNYIEVDFLTGEKTIVWWENIAQGEDDFGDFLTSNNQNLKVDLTLPSLIDIFESGENVIASISYSDADWKYPFKQNRGGSSAELTGFGSEEYIRFCPGYLLPEGDNVIFDFASPIFTECYGYFTKTGEMMSHFDILTEDGFSPRAYDGTKNRAYLTTFGPWLLRGYNGQKVRAKLATTILLKPKRIEADQRVPLYINTYPPYWSMGAGEMSRLAQLSVSLPGISWVTPDGCIENRYNPLTPDGDWDYNYDSYGIAIEYRPYFGKIEAMCDDSVYIYYNILQPEMMANNLFLSEPSFQTNKEFVLDFETGEDLYVQEYVAPTGEEIFLELILFESEPLGEFEENRGEQSSWASIEYNTSLYPVAESGAMGECELINGNEPEPNILEFG